MPRQRWGHQAEYILTLMGFNIGVGSIWKFPYMCARNGGGSYLIPYLFFTLVGAVPLTYLEMFLGQYSQGGALEAWDLCPALKGLAIGAVCLSWLFSVYYSSFFAWILYYLFYSFYPTLPWTQCGQDWNTPDCVATHSENATLSYNATISSNVTLDNGTASESSDVPAAEEFFRRNVLQITSGLESMGELRWPLVLCLAITFLSVYICIIKGIRLAGKVVYFTVICPYILVTVILIRALTLPGSLNGILYYITPDFKRLRDFNEGKDFLWIINFFILLIATFRYRFLYRFQAIGDMVWMEACSFALYAPGITYGIIIKMAAHNPKETNCFRDAVLVNILCMFSQVYFGFSVFGITGHLAHIRGVTMEHYKTSGFKLGFITYPEATSFLPLPQLWSVLLFVMLFTLGIDSLIPSCEVVTDALGFKFPRLAKRRWLLNAAVLIPSFCLALPYTAQGGVYLLTLVEWFAFFPSLILFAVLEAVAVAWIFGINRVNDAMISIWGTRIVKGVPVFWKFICPALLLVIFGYSFFSYRPPQFEDYIYPNWANALGWCISSAIVLPLPVYFVYSMIKAPGQTITERLSAACKPTGKWAVRTTNSENKEPDTNDVLLMEPQRT